MCDLPTRTSFGCIYVGDSTPRPGECAFSLPQHLYVSTFTGWTDPQASPDLMKSHMRRLYRQAEKVGCGMYVADYDATDDTENVSLFTPIQPNSFLSFSSPSSLWCLDQISEADGGKTSVPRYEGAGSREVSGGAREMGQHWRLSWLQSVYSCSEKFSSAGWEKSLIASWQKV